MQTRFVLLSDIHFKQEIAGEVYDLDKDLRRELLRDLRRMREEVGEIYGVLVNGDIAYRGSASEYEFALEFLAQVSEAVGCAAEQVWTVPGNHDVDRSVIVNDKALRAARQEMRTCPRGEIDRVIREWSMDADAGGKLYQPIAAYNKFAATFGCDISAAEPVWTYPVALNDNSTLCLVGLNSTLCCDASDSREFDHRKVVLGRHQAAFVPEEDGVVYLALCHHPTTWFRDEDTVADLLAKRHHVLVFGHEHMQRPYRHNDSCVLRVGAMQPEREEAGWSPTYNLVGIHVDRTGDSRQLVVELRTRVWHRDHVFVAEPTTTGAGMIVNRLNIPPLRPPERSAVTEVMDGAPSVLTSAVSQVGTPGVTAGKTVQAAALPTVGTAMDAKRRLVYHFLTLAHPERMSIALDLGLLREEDDGVRDRELVGRLFARAAQEHRLHDLWDEVERRHPDGQPEPNPFP